MNEKIVTIAALLKNQGYATGQFGKNHLGDLNHMLPTNHGFDEFFGNLYHLNAEEEPEMDDYPRRTSRTSARTFGPRGVIHSWATDKDDPTVQPRWGKVGKQKIEDTGPLTKKRMETCDDDFVAAAKDFIKRQNKAGKPFFVWLNTTHMHLFTHTKKESLGQAGRWQSPYHDTMIDHDKNVGADARLARRARHRRRHLRACTRPTTARTATRWPDGGMTPFRSEKNTNWEGAFRVPLLVRWPGKIEAGSVCQRDRAAPRLAADLPRHGRATRRRRQAEEGLQGDRPHLQEPHRRLQPAALPDRQGEGEPAQVLLLLQRRRRRARHALRQLEDRVHGAALPGHDGRSGREPFTRLRLPKIFNLRTDPYEFADITSNTYYDWFLHNAYFIYAAQAAAAKFAETFKEFPPVQKPNTFTIDDAMAKMAEAGAGLQ